MIIMWYSSFSCGPQSRAKTLPPVNKQKMEDEDCAEQSQLPCPVQYWPVWKLSKLLVTSGAMYLVVVQAEDNYADRSITASNASTNEPSHSCQCYWHGHTQFVHTPSCAAPRLHRLSCQIWRCSLLPFPPSSQHWHRRECRSSEHHSTTHAIHRLSPNLNTPD